MKKVLLASVAWLGLAEIGAAVEQNAWPPALRARVEQAAAVAISAAR